MLKFKVTGSSGDIYEIVATRDGINFRMSCTCEAGQHGMYCKHRFSLMNGDITSLLSENSDDVARLKDLLNGTDVERRYKIVCDLEAEKMRIDSKLKFEKKALAKEMTT